MATTKAYRSITDLPAAIRAISGNNASGGVTPADPILQEKYIAPATVAQTVTPDENYDGLSKVTVSAAPLEEKTVTPTASTQTVTPSSGNYGLSKVTVGGVSLQEKSVSPATSKQTVTPDASYSGLSKVTVSAVSLQEKSVTPTTSQQIITPDASYTGLSKVTVAASIESSPMLQQKTVTPATSSQTVTPDMGYTGLSKVTVEAVSLQNRTVTPSANSSLTITPTSASYMGLGTVTVEKVPLTTKTVTPTSSSQTITPGSGYLGFSSVTVNAAPASASLETLSLTIDRSNAYSSYPNYYANYLKLTSSGPTWTRVTLTKTSVTIVVPFEVPIFVGPYDIFSGYTNTGSSLGSGLYMPKVVSTSGDSKLTLYHIFNVDNTVVSDIQSVNQSYTGIVDMVIPKKVSDAASYSMTISAQ